MLFNSYLFLFLFLPITAIGFFQLGKYSQRLAALWLFAASLFFYGWWNPAYVGLLLGSIIFNYGAGIALANAHDAGSARAKGLLGLAVAANLGLLGYYKYANFLIENLNAALRLDWQIQTVILPLGISFFTFTQIAFLVDAYRGEGKERNFAHYGLFVTYFPHLIAGPVLHHKEMMPQFARPDTYRLNWENLAVGMTIFAAGLGKKVVFADGIAVYASPVFAAAAEGATPTFLEAWGGALAYAFQLYFDFSGYSDMAIGLSRLFGVTLPLNFDSPYKARNIIEFWRRWHMTLSRFLRDYLYFALGGNRKGVARRYLNLFTTMLLGGLWHGAGWTFVIWGGLHGLYLSLNHGWQYLRGAGAQHGRASMAGHCLSVLSTFIAVVIGWVFFRASNIDAALAILRGMAGLNGFMLPLPPAQMLTAFGVQFGHLPAFAETPGGGATLLMWIAGLGAWVWCLPNIQQIMADFKPALDRVQSPARLQWRPRLPWLLLTACVLWYALAEMGKVSEFLYFQF